jgi:hypothetical protein
VSGFAGEGGQLYVGVVAVCPDDVDRRRGVALLVDLINHEVPFGGVASVTSRAKRRLLHLDVLRGGGLRRNRPARRTRSTEKHE